MASEITADGRVIAPLNITNPAPILSLRGFQWDTVDEEIHNPQPSPDDDEQLSTEQTPMIAGFKPSFQRAAAAPPLLEAPRLPAQLAEQLGAVAGRVPPPPDFPLAQFRGAYAGNGFNTIFRPRFNSGPTAPSDGPNDNILELNLTTEQLTFGATLGKIPNRGFAEQPDITLGGLPYLQTIQDVTNEETGKGDKPKATDIHFEPGIWLNVPAAIFQKSGSVVRMASIPHGTTVNAQGLIPTRANTTALGGAAGPPNIGDIDTTPFPIGSPSNRLNGVFKSMDAAQANSLRIPQNLQPFVDKRTITTEIIKNPNIVLRNAIKGQNITETISFEVSTGPPAAELNGGGTANISFLAGKQDSITTAAPGKTDNPNAHAEFMKSRFWIETVAYQVNVPKLAGQSTVLLRPTMPSDSTAPTPVFAITAPPGGVPATKEITVAGIQIQYSQIVNLNFGPPGVGILTWPHVSVATLVPTEPQPFQMT